jgi:hypothetical protein
VNVKLKYQDPDVREIFAHIDGEQAGDKTTPTLVPADSVAWPEPRPIPEGLLPVKPLALDLLPKSLAPWVGDISERIQCPPDYVAVTALTALGAVIGRRIAISPQEKTD